MYLYKQSIYQFHPSLIFLSKARNLTLEWSKLRGTTQVGSILSCKYKTNTLAYCDIELMKF